MPLPKTRPTTGFLFHEDCTIKGLSFYLHGGNNEWLSAKLSILRSTGDTVERVVFGGSAQDVESISEDGATLTLRSGKTLGKAGLSMLFNSINQYAPSEVKETLAAAEDHGLTNLKVKFTQLVNDKRTAKAIEKGRAKVNPNTGEYYKETDLVVEAVYGYADFQKPEPSDSSRGSVDLSVEAAKILQRVLDGNRGEVSLNELRLKAIAVIGAKNPNSLKIQRLLGNPETLIQLAEQIGAEIDGQRIVSKETVPF